VRIDDLRGFVIAYLGAMSARHLLINYSRSFLKQHKGQQPQFTKKTFSADHQNKLRNKTAELQISNNTANL
jgi:hypothetical protein